MLSLEIEYLTGVCFAAQSQSSDQPDWPPQPDRVFSALVAAWGSRGESPVEKTALEWLEQQSSPEIYASDAESRRVGISFVPPNDSSGKPEVMPERRRRQARMFPAAIPHRPLVRFTWSADPATENFVALQALALDTSYLGHSASVVRCRFVLAPQLEPKFASRVADRRVYPGRLSMLQEFHNRGERPPRGEVVMPEAIRKENGIPRSVLSADWILFEDAGGDCPDVRGIAVVARRLRDALLSRYRDEGIAIPEIVSGHLPDGAPSNRPHMGIVPLIDAGWQYSAGRLMGLAVFLPRETDKERIDAERDWLAGLEDDSGSIALWRNFERLLSSISHLKLGKLGVWKINRTLTPAAWSMHAARFAACAKRWRTVTPIALDRHAKAKNAADREQEVAEIIADSCINIGLPSPRRIAIDKHSAVKGAPSAYPSGNAPTWTGWTLSGSLASRVLTHAVIEFGQPVHGPVIVGAGRYVGLGVCMSDPR